MSYLLEFPPSTLPDKILAPSLVEFAINGVNVVRELPSRIPLTAVLHFIPRLAQYVLPAPENLPTDAAQEALRIPRVGIDIRLDIGAGSLQRIIFKVLQSAGEAVPNHLFQHPPGITTSISIRKTWLLLELHPAGIDSLMIHLQTLIMTGPAVTFVEIQDLFNHFPLNSNMLRVTAINFVKSHLDNHYSFHHFAEIRRWYMAYEDRYKVFKTGEEQFPEFESSRNEEDEKREEKALKTALLLASIKNRMEKLEAKTAKQGKRKTKSEEAKAEIKANSTVRKSTKWRSSRSAEEMELAILRPDVYDPSKPSS